MKGSKILATIVAIAMVMSTMIVLNEVTDFKLVENVSATGEVTNDGSTTGLELTCGEIITFKVVDNSLTYNENYALGVWNGSAWIKLEEGSADYNGDITIEFHVPWWDLLGTNPIGDWNIRLFNTTSQASMGSSTQVSDNVTLTIGNIFDVIFKEGSDTIEYLSFNKSYGITNQFGVSIRNYTGATYDDGDWDDDFSDVGDPTFDYALYLPDGTEISDWGDTGKAGSHAFPISSGASGTGYYDGDNYETFYWVNVTQTGSNSVYSNVSLPCKLTLNWSSDEPSGLVWGTTDDIDLIVGVYDGNGDLIISDNNYVSGYEMAMYYPSNGGYTLVTGSNKDTYTGYYIVNDIDTDDYNAGTWYIGTMETECASYRISESEPDKPSGLGANFIPYLSFEVATYDDIDVDFENSDEVISGFDQTINVSIRNNSHVYSLLGSDWASDLEDPDYFHITGLKAWNSTANVAYDDEDIVAISEFDSVAGVTLTRNTEKYAYYEFTYHFNETGTATVIVQYPGNGTYIEGQDSYFSDTYDNENLLPNFMGETTFDVDSPGNLNMVVRGTMPSAVNVLADSCSDCYYNQSQNFFIDFYGSDSTERVNATLEVSGCGLDFTIEQDDTPAGNDYLMAKGNGWYQVKLEPKIGGTLSLTATNGSDTDSADYSIDGLTGSVTTSVGDDLYISVTQEEKITVEVKSSGGYPIETGYVYLTFYDEDWNNVAAVNNSYDDDLEGTDGIYEFVPGETDIDEIGYIVCAAKSASLWMYDVIEIEPIHDIDVTIINPEGAENQTLTVGIDDQTLELNIKNPAGDILEGSSGGSPTVTGYLIDDDHSEDDPLQTLTFEQKSAQDKWVLDTSGDNFPYWPGTLLIKAVNNTGEDEHDGNVSIPVEYATVTFSPSAAVAGIAKKNVTVEITVLDALGNPVEDGTDVYLNLDDATDTVIDSSDNPVEVDEDGKGEFEIDEVGDLKGSINCTFVDTYANNAGGNRTSGIFTIDFPDFTILPDTISTELNSATVTVTAKDFDGEPIKNINITFAANWVGGTVIETPDPVMTDPDGIAVFDIVPLSSGKANVTILQGLEWTTGGTYTWDDTVYTSDYLTVTRQTLDVTVSPTTVYEGDSFTVTVKDDGVLVDDVDVTFDGTTEQTEDGVVSFTAGDPGIDSQQYTITIEKDGYPETTATVTVINVYEIKITGPSDNPKTGEKFTVTVVAKGAALAGATVTFEGKEVTTDDNGKATLTAPSEKGTYTITATYEESEMYGDGTLDITVESGTPGFELLTLIAAIGVAFILLRRRRNK